MTSLRRSRAWGGTMSGFVCMAVVSASFLLGCSSISVQLSAIIDVKVEIANAAGVARGSRILVLPFRNAPQEGLEAPTSGATATRGFLSELPKQGLVPIPYVGEKVDHLCEISDLEAQRLAQEAGADYALWGTVLRIHDAGAFGRGDELGLTAIIIRATNCIRIWECSGNARASNPGSPARCAPALARRMLLRLSYYPR